MSKKHFYPKYSVWLLASLWFFHGLSRADFVQGTLESHQLEAQIVSDVETIHSPSARVSQVPCPKEDRNFSPSLVDYQGRKIGLSEPGAKRPTVVIVAGAESKDKVLKFLAEFAKPLWQYKRTSRIYGAVKDHGRGLIYDSWNESFEGAWKKFKNEMGKLDDLRVVLLADARPLYEERLKQGWKEAEAEREKAIVRGRIEGSKKGAQIGASKGRDYGFPVLKNWIGLMEEIGRQKGSEEGARRGSQLASEITSTFIPPYVTFIAEKELLKKSDELLPSVKKILENRLVKNFDEQCSLSILVDQKDFEKGATEASKDKIRWANGYMPEDKKMDVEQAIQTHREFMTETNSASEILSGVLGGTEPGFHVILIDPNGNKLKSWSNQEISPHYISSEYIKYWEHLQGLRKIPGCP